MNWFIIHISSTNLSNDAWLHSDTKEAVILNRGAALKAVGFSY